jgi:hypothetical protein
MKKTDQPEAAPLCPSAQPQMADAVVFAVVAGTPEERRAGYLAEPLPTGEEVLALAAPAKPTEVFRLAASCAGTGCKHFDGLNCRLAERIVQQLSPVVDRLPPCAIRPACRWWCQEGKAACLRCPQVVTETSHASNLYRQVADPESVADIAEGGEQRPPNAG